MFIVTGPTGNVGFEVSRYLVDKNPEELDFRLAAHSVDRVVKEFGPATPVRHLDFDDPSTWPAVLEGGTTLFLLFPLPHPRTAKRWMVPFIDAAKEAGISHIIYVTVPGGDASRVIPHNTVEQHIKASGLGWTLLRPSYFMQNLVRALSTHGVDIAERDEIYIPAGKSTTTFVDSRDLAEVIAMIAADPVAHHEATYLLTGEHKKTYFDVADALSESLGRPIRYTHPSRPAFYRRMRKRGLSRDTVFFMCVVYTLARRGRNNPVSDDLPRLLGRDATTLRQFAQDYRWRWETETWT